MLATRYPSFPLCSRPEWLARMKNRVAWAAVPATTRAALIRHGEKQLGYPWPPLLATSYLEFIRNGNRTRYEGVYFERRSAVAQLALAECAEGRGRFLDALVNGLWLICEESTWVLPAHIWVQRERTSGLPDVEEPVVDLFAGETAMLLATVVAALGEPLRGVVPLIIARIEHEVRTRFLTPLLQRDFHWMGLAGETVNNWNPWIVSNWLGALLVLEPDEARRSASVQKALRVVDAFIDSYPPDGGCDEGPSYWGRAGASLYEALDLLDEATGGAIRVFDEPLIQEIGRFINRAHIGGNYYLNFADGAALVTPPAAAVFGYGKKIGDPALKALGAWLGERHLARMPESACLSRDLALLEVAGEIAGGSGAEPPLLRESWLPVLEIVAARESETAPQRFFLGAKGGHNAESHNHNDVGHFVVYRDGLPLLIDPGVESYSRKTFSPQRYEIWTMQSAWHNLPLINGIQQAPGREYRASGAEMISKETATTFRLNIAGAYPEQAGIIHWWRTLKLERPGGVTLHDAYRLKAAPPSLVLHLITPCAVEPAAPGELRLARRPLANGRESASGIVTFDPALFTARVETLPLEDANLKAVWGGELFRIHLEALNPGAEGEWTVRISA